MLFSVNAALFVALFASSNVVNAQSIKNFTTSFSGNGFTQASAGGGTVLKPSQKVTKNNPLPDNDDESLSAPIFYNKQPHTPGAGDGWNGWAFVLTGHYWSNAINNWAADKIPVRIIYYYNFNDAGSIGQPNYVNDFFNRLDGSSWWNVVRKYYNLGYQGGSGPSSRQYVQGVKFDRSDNYDCNWAGKCAGITGVQIQGIINEVINWSNTPVPTAGFDKVAYFVVLGYSITESFDSGSNKLGGNYCAYHSTYQTPSNLRQSAQNKWIKYGVVRIPDGNAQCNFNPQAAGINVWGWEQNLIYHMAHELVEIITDPNPAGEGVSSAWKDKYNNEAMDKCERFTPSLTTRNSDIAGGNPGLANVNINGRILILPAIWDPVHQKCVLSDLGPNPWVNIGCFKDSGSRALSHLALVDNGGMTNERCQAECGAKGFGYAGTEAGGECWCSNSYPNQGSSGNCNSPCSADPTTNCGGGWALNVWQLGGGQQLIRSHIRDNFCMDLPSTATGAIVDMYDCHGRENQRWTYNSNDQTIRVKQNDYCLDVPNGNAVGGQKVQTWACNGGSAQKWKYNAKDRTIRLAANTNLCLDVLWASDANGSQLQLQACGTKNAAQAWHIAP